MIAIGVDTGGTFTDFVITNQENGETVVFKIPSTPKNPTSAIINGYKKIIDKDKAKILVHGTTVGTNAILERKGPKVILITTKNFEDIIEIGRQKRPKLYSLEVKRPKPLVGKKYRLGVDERINSEGEIIKPLDSKEIKEILKKIKTLNGESVAISLLFSFKNEIHEKKIKQFIEKNLSIPVSASYEVLPEFREFERTSTTVIDAFLKPIVTRYLEELDTQLKKEGFAGILNIFKSDAGISFSSTIKEKPSELLLSGLAGGIKAAHFTSKIMKIPNLISIDIGGTSTDVGIIVNGRAEIKKRTEINGLVNGLPVIDVETIGAGGGSLAQITDGFFKVGPESAGSEPGPACYGKGNNNPTVTDADVVTGRLLPENFAGGNLKIFPELAFNAVKKIADELGTDVFTAAQGIQEVYQNNIIAALRRVSIERGHDPKDFSLLGFGGQGPLHSVELGEKLGVKNILIPPYPGTWSAIGLLTADHRYETSRSIFLNLETSSLQKLNIEFKGLHHKIKETLEKENISEKEITFEYYLEMRFEGQGYEIRIKWEKEKEEIEEIKKRFLQTHEKRYGFILDRPIIVVNIVLVAVSPGFTLKLPTPEKRGKNEKLEPKKNSTIFYKGKEWETNIYDKKNIKLGDRIRGPSIILQPDTTIFVPPAWEGKLLENGHMLMRRKN